MFYNIKFTKIFNIITRRCITQSHFFKLLKDILNMEIYLKKWIKSKSVNYTCHTISTTLWILEEDVEHIACVLW